MAPISKKSKQAARMVLSAIKNLNLKGGATLKHIDAYIREKYPACQHKTNLRKIVENATAYGALEKVRNKYVLGSILDHIVQARRRRRKSGAGKKKRRRRRHHRR